MRVESVRKEDLEEILSVQYLSYQPEAEAYRNFRIQPLTETLTVLEEQYEIGTFLKLCDDDGRILGSVRGYLEDDIFQIRKVFVHPCHRRKGYGTMLLRAMEEMFADHKKQLFAPVRMEDATHFFEKNGYLKVKKQRVSINMEFYYLEKK